MPLNKQVHIIAFDVPFPPDYGGVIDIYYKLKALYEEGIKISLHCFEYGRGQKKELEKYCEKVFYYRRKSNKHLLFNSLPYIAASRSSEELMNNLLKDDAPILLEGLHCCFHLKDERIKSRKKIVRMHNIEHTYYANLALVEKNYFRRKYFEKEAKKLEKFEAVLKYADAIGAISPSDTKELSLRYKNVSNVMAFHPHEIIEIKDGKGDFALYHGSLAIGENNKDLHASPFTFAQVASKFGAGLWSSYSLLVAQSHITCGFGSTALPQAASPLLRGTQEPTPAIFTTASQFSGA